MSKQPALDRWDWALAFLLGLAAFGLYAGTLARGVLPSDSGEFQVLGNLLASAHNPGYWVYLLLVKAFTMISWGDAATRVSLFSAATGAVTVAAIYLAGRLLAGRRWAGALGALALAICPVFWSQAVIAEVYTSGTAFTAGILLLLLVWEGTRRNSLLFWAGLLGGLSPGVHGTVGLVAPAAVALIAFSGPDWRRVWKPALGGAALGLALLVGSFVVVDANQAPYNIVESAYLPSRSNFDTSLAELQSPLGRFRFLITSRQWSTAMFRDPTADTFERGGAYYAQLPDFFSVSTLALMLLGFVRVCQKKALGVFFLLAGLAHHLFVFNYRIGDSYAFYLAWFPYACVLAAAGLGWLLDWLEVRLSRPGHWRRWASGGVAVALMTLGVAPFFQASLSHVQRGEALMEGYSFSSGAERAEWYSQIHATVQALPPNALVLVGWQDLYAYYYAAYLDGNRSDLAFVEPTPYSAKGGMAASMVAYVREAATQRPVLAQNPQGALRQAGLEQSNTLAGPTRLYEYSP